MISFSAILEYLFKGFNASADTDLVTEIYDKDPQQSVMIVKKSGYFLLFTGVLHYGILSILGAACLVIFFYLSLFDLTTKILLSIVYGGNVLLWLFFFVRYLLIHKKVFHTYSINTAGSFLAILRQADGRFRSLINQTGTLIVLYVLFCVFCLIIIILLSDSLSLTDLILLSTCFLFYIVQIRELLQFTTKCIDLSMDFLFITNAQIKYYDQKNFGLKTSSIAIDDVKSIASKKDGFVGSLLDFGTVSLVIAETNAVNEIVFPYMKSPEQLEKAINSLKYSQP